jgi:hypothetical protein
MYQRYLWNIYTVYPVRARIDAIRARTQSSALLKALERHPGLCIWAEVDREEYRRVQMENH